MTKALTTTAKTDPREDVLITLLAEGKSLKDAGLEAGYSKQYCESSIVRKWESDRFLSRLIKHHRAKAIELLPKTHKIDQGKLTGGEQAIQALSNALQSEEDPDKRLDIIKKGMGILAKLDHTQERIAKNAGLLRDEKTTTNVMIPVKDMQLILNQQVNVSQDSVTTNGSGLRDEPTVDITP